MRKRRANINKGEVLTNDGANKEVLYPAILAALVDPIKRRKLEAITLSLKKHRVTDKVTYGFNGPDFNMVGDLLEITA